MTANDLYHDLILQGFSLSVNGERLTLSPSSQLTDELRTKIRSYKADLMALLATNDHYEKIAVSEVCPKLDAPIHYPKSAVENISPHIEDGQLTPMEEVTPTWLMDRYAHLITCQQCEHLTDTGYCRVKPLVKPMPEAMHDCGEFNQLKTERISIVNAPYTQSELKDLLDRNEKPLFQHMVDCRKCCLEDSYYCEDVFTIGSNYEYSLLCFDDADRKRESLLNAVVKARVTRRKVFVGYPNANVPQPC
jgi:hypothetical protein